MTDIPRYHAQPATLDERVELPEDREELPLAMGHDEDAADDVAEALQTHKETVKDEREAARRAREEDEPEPGSVRTPDQVAKDEAQDEAKDDQEDDEADEPKPKPKPKPS
jgi:hypothetical protein